MFYVYDVDGLKFKGPLEALEQQRRVKMRAAITPIDGDRSSAPSFSELSENSAVATYQKAARLPNMLEPLVHAYQIMTSPVATVNQDMFLGDVWEILERDKIRQVVVLSDRKEVVGVLSDRDILRHINVIDKENDVRENTAVSKLVSKETITTDAMSDIRRIAKIMAFEHIEAMPVLQDQKLVGIITRGDILRGFADHQKLNLWG